MIRRTLASMFLISVAAIGVAGWYAWQDLHTVPPEPPAPLILTVQPGSSLRQVANQLHRSGLLRHPALLVAWARHHEQDRSIRAGTYRVQRGMSPIELLEMLNRGPLESPVRVTIPEGLTAAQIATLFEQKGLGGSDVFACAMADPDLLLEFDLPPSGVEGFLFPDTYALVPTMETETILRTLLARFREQSASLRERRIAAGLSELEMVTLASIIEKETGRAEERPLISAVFHNRLRLGMPLQSDPTVIYGLADFAGNLTRDHLADSSPYNTYANRGLPPGPIANPGLAALEAAVAPAESKALYFVSRNDGSHEFSRSLREHNRAVHRFQKRRR